MLRSTTPRKVNFADNVDSKNCTTCDAHFTIICLKHTCKACNKDYCGKCSKSNVTTVSNTLVRERLCNCCSNLKSASKAQFTPSKLNLLDGYENAASKLWSADSDSDCSDEDSPERDNVVGHCLSDEFITDQENNESANLPCTKEVQSTEKQRTASSTFDLTPAQHKLLRSLCDASFSDNTSVVSSASSKAASSAAKSPASGLRNSCSSCQTTFNDIARRHMCSHCTKMVCGGCSSPELLVRDGNVLRHRVCKTCQPALADAPFTPGKLHLLNQQDTGTGSNVTHRRQLQNKLWSADTDSDSDDSVTDSAQREIEEVDLAVESVAENLLDDLAGEETHVETMTNQEEGVMQETERSVNLSSEWDVHWELHSPALLNRTAHSAVPIGSHSTAAQRTDEKQISRAPLLVLVIALFVVVFAALWAPVATSILSLEDVQPPTMHASFVSHATSTVSSQSVLPSVEQLLIPASETEAQYSEVFRSGSMDVMEQVIVSAAPETAASVETHHDFERKAEPQLARTETKVTMLLYAPTVSPVLQGKPRAKMSVSQILSKFADAKKMSSAVVRVRTRLASVFNQCWREVRVWINHAHTTYVRFLARVLASQRLF